MKTSLLAIGMLVAASVSAMDIDKDIVQTRVLDAAGQPLGTVSISDLAPDGTFDGTGSRTIDFNSGTGELDIGLRVFPAVDGGYWLIGYQIATNNAKNIAIAKIRANGSYDTSYNGTGKRLLASTMLTVADVAMGIGETFYFVGTQHTGSFTDDDIQVRCVDSTGAPCDGFGADGVKYTALDLGDSDNRNDKPYRIVWFASQLYIVGETDTGTGSATNKAAFAINLNPSTGALNTGFGNFPAHPGVFVYNNDSVTGAREAAYDVLAYSPSPFAYRLVMVGTKQIAAGPTGDIDGFTISINGATGQADGFIADSVYGDLGTSKQDSLTRIARRHNGGFVVAGYAFDDSASPARYELLLAAYRADGSNDNSFGDSSNIRHQLLLSGTARPYGLAERADTRDLVVGINIKDDLFGDGHPMQGVVQLGRRGQPLHAVAVLDFNANSAPEKNSFGNDLITDPNGDIVTAGTREWSIDTNNFYASDFDMTIGRFVANDTIFADPFGGANSD